MEFSHDLVSFFWLLLLFLLIWRSWFFKSPVGGIGICHWLNQAINHFFGEVLINQNDENIESRGSAVLGYQTMGYGILGLIFAFIVVQFLLRKKRDSKENKIIVKIEEEQRSAFVALIFGLTCYFFLSSVLSFIPSITAIVSSGLAMAAGALAWGYFVNQKIRGPFYGFLASALVFIVPALTVLINGFMGFGVYAVFGVGGVFFSTFKPRVIVLLVSPAMLFLGLSIYPSYMLARNEIRDSVWGGDDINMRIQKSVDSISSNWQWFDPSDSRQMELLNGRLNQNVLVGAASEYIASGNASYAYGETLVDGVLALIPRAIWIDKPIVAGSGGLVTRFTGIKFASGTSVGIGNLMEFYVNGGTGLVFLGFFTIGILVYWLDNKIGIALESMDFKNFLRFFVPGQGLMNSIGSFVEWGPSLVGSVILVQIFLFYFDRFFKDLGKRLN